jgi:transposase
MTNWRHIPKDQKKLIITMLEQGMSPKEVSHATRFGLSTVYHVRKLWLATGSVVKESTGTGRPRALTSLEVNVCCKSSH